MAKPLLSAPDSIIISYLTLRKIIGFLGIGLVPLLVIGAYFTCHEHIKYSVSAYYYSCMRNEFEGVLCCMALFLLSYHGYAWQDSLISKLAGLFALGIAFFPTSTTNDKNDIISILHYVCSGIFFALLSYMSVFLFTKTDNKQEMTPEKRKRNRVYRFCGITMALSVIGIPVDGIPVIHDRIAFIKPTLIFEIIALISFGLSWLTKGEFILKDK